VSIRKGAWTAPTKERNVNDPMQNAQLSIIPTRPKIPNVGEHMEQGEVSCQSVKYYNHSGELVGSFL
jgi:hypothetical protein